MKATDAINLAKQINMSIGRTKSNQYYSTQIVNNVVVENTFHGKWADFVRFIQNRVELAK